MKYSKLEQQSLMVENVDYVEMIVRKLVKVMNLPRDNFSDYVSAGYIGLAEAAERYDSSNGTTFKQYAFLRVRGSVIDSIRANSVHTGKAYKMAKALQSINEIRLGSIDQELKHKEASMSEILNFACRSGVLYQLCMGEVEAEVSVNQQDNPLDLFDRKQRLLIIKEIIESLPEKQRIIMEEYYYNDLSFTEISNKYPGMSKSWISRLHDKAVITVHKKFLDYSVY